MLYSRVRNDRQLSNSGTSGTTGSSNINAGTNDSGSASGTARSSGSIVNGPGTGTTGTGGSTTGGASAADRDSFSRWRDRQYYGPRRWFQNTREESQWDKDNGTYLISSEKFKYTLAQIHFLSCVLKVVLVNCYCTKQ